MSIQSVYSHRYPDADTYTGNAAHEIDHHEFIKIYGVDSAVSDMVNAMETAAVQNNYKLLTVDINYDDSGLAYHMFDVDITFTSPGIIALSNNIQYNTIQQMLIDPITLLAIFRIVVPLLITIIYYFMETSVLKSIDKIFYTPDSAGGGGLSTSTVIKYGIILIAATYFLNAITKTSHELRR
jgi:hypothetical protein